MKPMHSYIQRFSEKRFYVPGIGVVALIIILFVYAIPETASVASTTAKKTDFSVSISVSGEIRAANSVTLTTPRTRAGQLQIVYLVPEGTTIKAGDEVMRFATTDVDKQIADKQNDLSIARSDYEKMIADQGYRNSDQDASLTNAELTYEQAKLQVEKMKFESDVARKEADISLQKSRIAWEQTKKKIATQVIVDKTETSKFMLRIRQIESDIKRANDEKVLYTMKAPIPGLVVYEINWNTGRKISVGNTPWPGMSLVSLPDLSKMQVVTNINEVDISKVKKGQKVKIALDAFPDKQFTGTVEEVGTIGQQKSQGSSLKTFEVIIGIHGTDPILKPGMTTGNEILIETIPQAVSVPIESVFDKEGRTVVYLMNSARPRQQEVKVGVKNSNNIVITEGVREGDKVALRDPTVKETKAPEKSAPAQKATRL
ncbi:MAG TPA: efflux RND transporter periplasmic adaptor subunit [Bacteroidota bacterium]|nr:efflux RND transporter periplasmic adaptor subunit [Bacteroidota bacterium]